MNFEDDLKNNAVLITGASRGIGRSCAEMFSEIGCKIGVHYHKNKKAAQSVKQALKTEGHIFQADLSHESECTKLISQAKASFGRLDTLVINHGIWEEAKIENITSSEISRTINLNLNSTFYLIREAIPLLSNQKNSSIVMISSTAGQRGESGYSHYAASKGGMISLTKSLAVELAPKNIRVNAVAPGWVKTDMTESVLQNGNFEKIKDSIPLKRIALPEDIAPAVLFLASHYARHITGEILNINGGAVLCG